MNQPRLITAIALMILTLSSLPVSAQRTVSTLSIET